jgi:hypothetical protein
MADTKKPVAPSAAPELADPAQVPVPAAPPAVAITAAPELADPAQVPVPAAPPAVAITVAPNGTVTNQIGGGR